MRASLLGSKRTLKRQAKCLVDWHNGAQVSTDLSCCSGQHQLFRCCPFSPYSLLSAQNRNLQMEWS